MGLLMDQKLDALYEERFSVPAVVTNTPRPGETPEQIAARTAPRGPQPPRLQDLLKDYPPVTHGTTGMDGKPVATATRTFSTGATRDTDEGKLDFEGFLSPLVLKAFAEYMHEKRKMPDGTMRASDNWQLGIPVDQYMKSMFRHFFSVWESHRGNSGDIKTELLALFFNVQGMLHEILKVERDDDYQI